MHLHLCHSVDHEILFFHRKWISNESNYVVLLYTRLSLRCKPLHHLHQYRPFELTYWSDDCEVSSSLDELLLYLQWCWVSYIALSAEAFMKPGVNFSNILRTAFTLVDPKSVKRYWQLDWILTLWGATGIKDARKYVDEIDTRTVHTRGRVVDFLIMIVWLFFG